MTDSNNTLAIGLDVGGTALKAGLVDRAGRVIATESAAAEAAGGVNHVIGRMLTLVQKLGDAARSKDAKVEAVGVGMPGAHDRSRGLVLASPNLAGWKSVPLVRLLSEGSNLRVVFDNDANNAALGEYLCGAGRGVRSMAMLTLGTGVGGGLILNGHLWRGSRGHAGEIGHTIVVTGGRPCGCGQLGCLEAYSSATATVARAAERIARGEMSALVLGSGGAGRLSTEAIVQAAESGDALARVVWEETCGHLAVACITLQHMLDLDRIVLAGGMSAAGEALRRPVIEAINRLGSTMMGGPPDIRIAELGNDAGFIGSALSVFEPA